MDRINKAGLDDDVSVALSSDSERSLRASNEQLAATVEDKLEAEWQRAAQQESKAVAISKGVVILALLVAVAVVISNVGRYIRNDQREDFEVSFDANAHKIIEAFHASIQRRLEAVDALSVAMTSHAKAVGAVFPFVTLPDYEIRSANARVLSNSYVINYFPVVSADQLDEWHEFTNQTGIQQHLESHQSDGEQRMAQDERFAALRLKENRNRRFLQTTEPAMRIEPVRPQRGDIALPLWQESPVTPSLLINYNVLGDPAAVGAYQAALDSGKATLGPANLIVGENEGLANYLTFLYSLSQYREVAEIVAYDPTSTLAYPVFDSFDFETRQAVGLFGLNINWRLLFQRVLASNVHGIYCVIDNSFNQSFTFRVDGSDAVYVGSGALHDADYEDMVRRADAKEFLESVASPITQAYTSVDLDYDYCTFSLRVYPSADTEIDYRNRDATVFVLLILGVFVFTSLVFVAYDFLVARRQRNVMKRALTSSAIVSSLFPQQVREQLYKEAKAEPKKRNNNGDEAETVQDMMLRVTGGPRPSMSVTAEHSEKKSRPIAHQFENTTVIFADLAGFTLWSSRHTPEQVFELLEALFAKFDATAKRRGIFKVETIGDCYLAVAGLPDPNPMHAVACAKFAYDIVRHTKNITRQLASSLGADTKDLQLRVGMHSGHITAGVLRGEKSRFQVFGDTVNTASRMESTGQAGRIQVSESTANELQAKSKEHWLVAREDVIVAKGKGELQTYWLNVTCGAASSGGSAAVTISSAETDDNASRTNIEELEDDAFVMDEE